MKAKDFLDDVQQKMNESFKAQDPELLDTVFDIDGKKLYADKFRLSIISSTFKSMLSDRWNSSKNEPIKIKEYKFEDFKELLNFIYSGKCNITDSNAFTMLDMAEFYQIDFLKELCGKYLSKIELSQNNIFELMELCNKYSLIQMKAPIRIYISQNFKEFSKMNEFLNAKKCVIEQLLSLQPLSVQHEELFEAVYEWAENQAMKKQRESNEQNFNMNDVIKAEMTPFLPFIQFTKMELSYLINHVVKKGFIFSYNELSDILANAESNRKVTVTNSYGQSISGTIKCNSDTIEIIKSLKNCPSKNRNLPFIFWETKCNFPSTPSPLNIRDGIKWYLIYFPDGDIGVSSSVFQDCYLIAELIPETSGFNVTTKCKIHIE